MDDPFAPLDEFRASVRLPPIPDPAPSAAPPRIWPAVVVTMLAIPLTAMAGVTAVLIPYGVSGGELEISAILEWIPGFISTPFGLAVLLVPSQLTFLLAATVPAALSTERFRNRLRLPLGRIGLGGALSVSLGTATLTIPLAVGLAFLARRMGLGEDELLDFEGLLSLQGADALFVMLLLSLLPAVCEELLFRGYLLGRLMRRWPARNTILFTAVVFSIAHLHPLQAVMVFPLGLWLGFIVWRTGSIWPAVGAHAVNNGVALLIARESDAILAAEPTALGVAIGTLGIALVAGMHGFGRLSSLPNPEHPIR